MPNYTGTPSTVVEASGGTPNEQIWIPYTASYYQSADSDRGVCKPWYDNGATITAVKSKLLRCTNFGFAVGGGETITSLTGVIRRAEQYPGGGIALVPDLQVSEFLIQLRDSGGYINANAAFAVYWGGLTDWGYVFDITGLTPTIVNDPSFGIDIQIAATNNYGVIATGTLGIPSGVVDLVQLDIHTDGATTGGGGGGGGSFSNMGKFRRIPGTGIRGY
jgi:hypothetical protein